MKAGVDMKAETERVRTLLMDTVVLLCKNGLRFEKELKVEGLIGITIDADVFLVHINEQFNDSNEPVLLKEEDSDLNDDKSLALYGGQSTSKTQYLQQRTMMTSTFQQGHEFIDCDEEEAFGDAIKEETADYDENDHRNPRDGDGYSGYGHVDTSLIGSTRESTVRRSAPHWSFLSNNGDDEGDDVTDDGTFMSTYADASASYSQQQPLSHLDDQMQHSMDSNLLQWTDASQFATSVRPTNNRPIVNRCHPGVRKRRNIPRGRGRPSNTSWFPQSLGHGSEWPASSSEYTMPSVQARGRPKGRGGLRAKVETQASDGFSYGKLTTTKYVCNICDASYKHQCNLLTHQVRVHGRQKKKTGRRPKNADPDDDLGAM